MNNQEFTQLNNQVIGYNEERLIIMNEWGTLYFVPCDDEQISENLLGTIISVENLHSIIELDETEQEKIIQLFGGDVNGI